MSEIIFNSEFFNEILKVTKELGVSPLVPIESQVYFEEVIEEFKLVKNEEFSGWLRNKIISSFRAIKQRPDWIQGEEWPIYNKQPLIFVGQIDINSKLSYGMFHDDTSIYIFLSDKLDGEQKIVVQQH